MKPVELPVDRESCPINGLTFAPEWAGTNIFIKSQPVADHVSELFDDELPAITKASQRRRDTFSSGRVCARSVMAQVGVPACALPRRADGSAQWPADIVGSISHTSDWAVAAVALPNMSEVTSIGAWHATALFSFKESLYKCLAPDFGKFIEFHDVQFHNLASGRPVLRLNRAELAQRYPVSQLELRMAVTAEHVFTLIWRRASHTL